MNLIETLLPAGARRLLPAFLLAAVSGLPVTAAAATAASSLTLPALGSGGDTSDSAALGASLLVHLGFAGEFTADGDSLKDLEANPTLGVTPVVERRFGPNFALGAEWQFLWVKASDADGDRSKLWCPHLRARIAFPVYQGIEVGAMLGVGVGLFFDKEENGGFQLGLPSYRFAFGGAYSLNDQVKVVLDLGYQSVAYTRTRDVAGEDKDFDSQFNTMLLTTGLMAAF